MNCPSCRAPNPETQAFCGECGSTLVSADASRGHDRGPVNADGDATTGASFHPRDELETGTTFAGRYQIVEELGHGGMGRVYKVIDKEVRAKVALKLIRPDIAADHATIERFRQELKTARDISHKNICRMYDFGRDGTTYFLTMEYVSGQDLKSMIAMSGQLGVGTAISIAKQVCDGLAEAHRLGIVHRDLKPQNIQIDRGGNAKIMDFGIARSAVVKGLTDAGVALGTPQYMSPEQAEAKSVDARSDMYSLGIILYEMVTGGVPFDGETPLGVAMKHKLEAPRDPREKNPGLPADLGRLILKCLEKDKERRYQTAGDVHADLERIEQGLPTTAQVVPKQRPPTSKEITVHFAPRQLLAPAAVAIVVLAVAAGAWRWWSPKAGTAVSPPSGKPTLAVLYFENISGEPSLNMWRTGLPELLTTGLSQSRLLNVVSSDNLFSILKRLNLAEARRYSAEDLAGVAREGHAQYLLTGSVMKAGQSTVITTRLQNVTTGDLVRSSTIECLKEEEILSKVNLLAGEIKADLNLSPQEIASDASQPLGQVLTGSPEALRYYTEARRFHLNNEYPDAIRLYERAIAADPGFAMAYRAMAACYGNLGETAKQAATAKKALDLSDRLPDRLKYQVQITAFSASGRYPEVFDACKRLLALYPDDTIGLNRIAIIYELGEMFDKAAEHYETAVRSERTLLSVGNFADDLLYVGNYDKARTVVEGYIASDPGSVKAHLLLGREALAAGQIETAQREVEKASLLAPSNGEAALLRGYLALLRGDLPTAEREHLSILNQGVEVDRRNAQAGLACLYAMQGRFDRAREQAKTLPQDWPTAAFLERDAGRLDRSVKAFQDLLADPGTAASAVGIPWAMLGLGLSYVDSGDMSRAQKVAADLKMKGGTLFVRPVTRWSLAVSGAIATRQGDGRTAVNDLERAVATLPFQVYVGDEHALLLDLLGRAYVAAGDLAKAQQTYEKITTLTVGRLAWGSIYTRSYYQMGLIAERQGDKARARQDFGKFLDLWTHADPGQPAVADAKKRMAP
jgi:serine/threonine protein kinase/tetratricopeptide (TPR) repeat protein